MYQLRTDAQPDSAASATSVENANPSFHSSTLSFWFALREYDVTLYSRAGRTARKVVAYTAADISVCSVRCAG